LTHRFGDGIDARAASFLRKLTSAAAGWTCGWQRLRRRARDTEWAGWTFI